MRPPFHLQENMDRIALVTGGGRGIGAATALALARSGFNIWLNYVSDHAAAEQVKEQVLALGRDCVLVPFDVSNGGQVVAALEPLLATGVPYALVNNAGYARDGLLALMGEDAWKQVLSVHLDGFYHITHTVLPLMLRRRQGRIVNVVSTSGQSGVPGQVNYSAAKAGLIGATKALAAEVARRNILVNAVAPGFIETRMTDNLPKEHILPRIPLGRMGTCAEVADVICFLCSDQASYITGQVIAVNGGVYM